MVIITFSAVPFRATSTANLLSDRAGRISPRPSPGRRCADFDFGHPPCQKPPLPERHGLHFAPRFARVLRSQRRASQLALSVPSRNPRSAQTGRDIRYTQNWDRLVNSGDKPRPRLDTLICGSPVVCRFVSATTAYSLTKARENIQICEYSLALCIVQILHWHAVRWHDVFQGFHGNSLTESIRQDRPRNFTQRAANR